MSIEIDNTVWRPANEVLDEDELDHAYQPPTHLYGSILYPRSAEGHVQPPIPLIEVNDFSSKKWYNEQEHRSNAPIGTRVLLRRRFHDLVSGVVIQDTMMIRVDELHQWDKYHVFYYEHEPSPLPIYTKKRKFI
jgi:hypothetical protein